MASKQQQQQPQMLCSKPSSSFSTVSSASATSAATSRSGGSRLLFGEIDTSSERSSESYASVCNFVLCDSSTILKFWLEDRCRDTFLSCLPKRDLASLRLACHDFSVRAAPALFSDLSITFRPSNFTKPAKLAALDRLGFYVKTVHFNLPHTKDTLLPPLVDPDTGAELSFTYTPQANGPASPQRPKYGDCVTTDILSRQYPPHFHAATNVQAFVRAFSAFINLKHLAIHCPNYNVAQRYRRTIVDYALISLRIAIEKNCLNSMDTLTLAPIHPGALMYLSPMIGLGSSPRSASRWTRIRHLHIHMCTLSSTAVVPSEPDQSKLLQTYLRNFQANLDTFTFRWIGQKGSLPIKAPANAPFSEQDVSSSPSSQPRSSLRPLRFPRLKHFHIENCATPAADIHDFIRAHKPTIEELNLEDIELISGTWDDALASLTKPKRLPRHSQQDIMADIPIMLSPTAGGGGDLRAFPVPMERVEVLDQHDCGGRKSLRMSNWLSRTKAPTARRVREGLIGCEQQLKRVFRGSTLPWR